MGLILGKISVETPKFEILKSTPEYEIRKYSPCVFAQVTYHPSQTGGDPDGGFKILASYIGVFGQPQNTKPEKIAMTSPVITSSEKIAMTSPVVTQSQGPDANMVTMVFVLPSKYSKAEEAPKPTDERVVIKEEGERVYGVVTFSGVARDAVVKQKVEKLKSSLEREGYEIAGDFLLARFNPPWLTLPPLRTNEVMIPIKLPH